MKLLKALRSRLRPQRTLQRVDFPWRDYAFAVATKRGLFLSRPGKLHHVLPGQFYGLTFIDDALIGFECQMKARTGRLIRISRATGRMDVLVEGLSPGCHQIDLIRGQLYVTNTYENAILTIDPNTWQITGEHFPLGQLSEEGRSSANYAHINSIWFDGAIIRLLCHNETAKTGRPSEILECGPDMQLRARVPTTAGNAHNIVVDAGSVLICDSANATVSNGTQPIKSFDHFTRGLSLPDGMIVVGESEYASRENRENVGGWINYLDPDWNLIERQRSPGMVQEIRALFREDRALSRA